MLQQVIQQVTSAAAMSHRLLPGALYPLYRKFQISPHTMLSKLKNLLSPGSAQPLPTLNDQFPHPSLSPAHPTQCPFLSKQPQNHPQTPQKCPMAAKDPKTAAADSDSEGQQKLSGGCPFMGGSERKKNPNLQLKEEGYNEPFVSKYKYYLSANKIGFGQPKKPTLSTHSRQLFDAHPLYLQHTLFFNGPDYRKARSLECCSRFMAYDQLRETGNKKFNKGLYYQALDYYERALSLFRWLEHQEPHQPDDSLPGSALASEQSIDECSEESRSNIDLEGKQGQQEDPSLEELKSQYKQFFVTYDDDNTRLFDGEEMSESADVDMRKSLMVQLYLNMAAAYIHTHHYCLAQQACDDALALTQQVSQIYLRKAQALALCRDASAQQLALAKQLITTALQMRPQEKIFSTANQNILKMLNLHNSAQAYQACDQHIDQRIAELKKAEDTCYDMVYARTQEIHQIEQSIIAQGRTPKETHTDDVLHNTTEMKILSRMAGKYVRVVEFYTEAKNYEQLLLAKTELQEVLRVQHQVQQLFSVQLVEKDGELGGLQSDKIQNRIAYVKTNFAEEVYNKGRFNFTMLEWVIKEIVKEEQEQQKARLEQEKRRLEQEKASQQAENGEGAKGLAVKGYGKYLLLLFLIPLAFILFNFFVV